ncbi:MAG: hypothetical protein JNM94_07330 [Phycisphaerae bacterium]|nr:hypothetical protein [Phycisphaerae bacterium]
MTLLLGSTIGRYVFENPWPLGGVLVVAAAVMAWRALTIGDRRLLGGAGIALAGSALVFVLSAMVTTPAERAVELVRSLVGYAEKAQTLRMLDLFSGKALMHYARPENPGMNMDEIRAAIATLDGRYRIVSNRITQLEGTTESDEAATVQLTCYTELESGLGDTPTSWWFRIAKQYDGAWKIERMAFLRVAGRDASPGLWR